MSADNRRSEPEESSEEETKLAEDDGQSYSPNSVEQEHMGAEATPARSCLDRRDVLKVTGSLAALSVTGGTATASEPSSGSTDDEPETYEPTWDSLEQHDVPEWFDDAKLGIFLHWGAYSVPAWAPIGQYAEWYPFHMHDNGSPTNEYHNENYGDPVAGDGVDDDLPEFEYKDFIRNTDKVDAPENFDAVEWDPDRWAEFFDEIGAGYVIPVGEHHDGFAMWDTDQTEWNAAQMGPQRDIIKELSEAVRDRGMKFAASYHRMYNYYDPRYTGLFGNPHYDASGPDEEFVEAWQNRWHDLMEHVKPDLIWWDGDWMAPVPVWESKKLVADYYNTAKHEWGKEVAVNDRLGQVRGEHGDFYTPEYEVYDQIRQHKWEATRGIGYSFGYNRQEGPEAYLSVEELVQSFVDVVSKNGNLLLNAGPKKNGRIPEIQKERLRGMGKWLDVNGEAIFETRPWVVPGEGDIRFTQSKDGETLYAIVMGWPGEGPFTPEAVQVDKYAGPPAHAGPPDHANAPEQAGPPPHAGRSDITLLGYGAVDFSIDDADRVTIDVPDLSESERPSDHAVVFEFSGFELSTQPADHAIESSDIAISSKDSGTVTVNATVHNEGYSSAPETNVRFLNVTGEGQTELASRSIDSLAPQRSTSIDVDWDVSGLEEGLQELQVVVDPDDEIDEISEENNVATKVVPFPLVNLAGEWQFHRGDDMSWKNPSLDDSSWETAEVPESWEDHSNYTKNPAYGWYRKTFTVPEEWAGYDLQIPLGKIDDVDETFFNGTKIGQSGTFPDDFSTAYSQVRRYTVPAEEVDFGNKNVIAIRVYDGQGGGGLYDGPLGPIGLADDS